MTHREAELLKTNMDQTLVFVDKDENDNWYMGMRNTNIRYYDFTEAQMLLNNLDRHIYKEKPPMSRKDQLEALADILSRVYFYGDWKYETPNERTIEYLLRCLGYWPIPNESDIVKRPEYEDLQRLALEWSKNLEPGVNWTPQIEEQDPK